MQFSETTVPPFTQLNCSAMVSRAWRWTSASSLASTITISEHHWTTLVSFGDQNANRYPPPTSLKQFEDVLQEEWYKIPLETVENLYESIPRGLRLYWMQKKVVQYHINKEMCTVSVVFPLFCPTPVDYNWEYGEAYLQLNAMVIFLHLIKKWTSQDEIFKADIRVWISGRKNVPQWIIQSLLRTIVDETASCM
jgi:hypothetical protein